MADQRERVIPSTPDASAATGQSRKGKRSDSEHPAKAPDQAWFTIGSGVDRASRITPYRRKKNDPLYRPLRIFSSDPAASRMEGAIALINVPYEPLEPGPKGSILEVDNHDGAFNVEYRKVNLEDPSVLIRDGRDPSSSDPLFHQQMSYAVCSSVYAAFKTALGREIAWGFDPKDGKPFRLRIRPHAEITQNAYYDKDTGELCFGYYPATAKVEGRNLPGGWIFTCLSHDVLSHEMTHAILDGLRAHFTYPSGRDVLAFHEAFADLVAIFQHFAYKEVVQAAIRKSRGNLLQAALLTDLALQFGHTTAAGKALRTAIDVTDESKLPPSYQDVAAASECHELGSVLVSAVFDVFITIFKRKTQRYLRLASNGSGILPAGELSFDLSDILAKEASQLASQFLNICIRAIDYCPPVDLEFGEYLRAAITADYDLVLDDPWGYRETWIDAFRRRGIYPRDVPSLSEEALLWRPPEQEIPPITGLSYAELKFTGDPGRPARELQQQATALASVICKPEYLPLFGLARLSEPRLNGDTVDPPCVQSIRSSRRTGPDGQIVFDLVAELTQRRRVRGRNGQPEWDFYGGATVILGPDGDIRYAVRKSILSEERLERQRKFMASYGGRRYWRRKRNAYEPEKQLFRMLHHTGSTHPAGD